MTTATLANPAIPTHGVNDKRLADLLAKVAECGKSAAKGDLSILNLTVTTIAALQDGVLPCDLATANQLWTTFQKARAKTAGQDYVETSSFKVQVSKFARIVFLCGLAPAVDAADIVARTRVIFKEYNANEDTRKDLVGNCYENIVTVARKQLEMGQRETPLTDDQIHAIIMPPKEVIIKTEADYLRAVGDTLGKIIKGSKSREAYPSKEAVYAVDALNVRIDALVKAERVKSMQEDNGPDVATLVAPASAALTETPPAPAPAMSKKQARKLAAKAAKLVEAQPGLVQHSDTEENLAEADPSELSLHEAHEVHVEAQDDATLFSGFEVSELEDETSDA